MKRILTHLLIIIIISCTLTSCMAVSGSDTDKDVNEVSDILLNVGDYILLGKYSDQPILWRYVAEDENGMLMLSDKVLCFKYFGKASFWAESDLRKWLNSDVPEGKAEWEYPYLLGIKYSFDNRGSQFDWEKGFLHEDNFNPSERAVMKSVTQWTMLPYEHIDLSENGETKTYSPVKGKTPYGGVTEPPIEIYYDISELPEAYSGAAHQLEDTVFLLDEMQIYNIWSNFGTVKTTSTPEAWAEPPSSYDVGYMLRTPCGIFTSQINIHGEYKSGGRGIRPAFYLDETNAVILSGSGTEADPYIIDGKSGTDSEQKGGINVFINGTRLEFDQPPIMESDRVLVPMRAIFEALGAQVSWEEATQTVTATKGDTVITLQIGRQSMIKNGKIIVLDTAAKLVGDRTLVPVRAVSEGLGASVTWNEGENTVEIVE